ncbi:phage major tail 2 family protein [Rickettsia hoogstraalii str. RCCE3]|uniref:phage tail tube protein n=1 Tax=Rickettsia hoogstraalii TaxID=467174 RepID=UPI00058FB9C7|nr:phage tail tube protein [Rickettsia hoogstraalii]KJV81258.1 phage major tail 2 family protein [Rickettsia hoogstraalii str. RCCE3]
MSTHAGSEGIVKIGDKQIMEVKSWSLEEVCDTVDASIIGTQWRKNQATIKSWSGSIDAFWNTEDNEGQGKLVIGNTVELRLYPEGDERGKYFSGTAIVTGISRQASFDGIVESSFTFQGNGELKQNIKAED